MDVFVDTNVLLDVLTERRPFMSESRSIWFLAERGRLRGMISALTFPNVYYVVRKLRDRETAIHTMGMLRASFQIVLCDE